MHRLSPQKRDIGYFVVFGVLFLLMAKGGINKYFVLLAISTIFVSVKRKLNLSYFIVAVHVTLYVALGFIIAVMTSNFTFHSVKQSLIFWAAPLMAVSVFSMYGKENSGKLIDIQFVALCMAYLILYINNHTPGEFYFESNYYAYIFGVYGLIHFLRKRYMLCAVAIMFMIIDNKRIVNGAFVFTFLCLLFLLMARKEICQKGINIAIRIMLIIVPILWVVFGWNGVLESFFIKHEIHSMGRLDGAAAWNKIQPYYDMSVSYIGKGSGWVEKWLGETGIPGFTRNLHNDFLVAYIELGFIGFLLWLFSFQIIIKYVEKKKNLNCANLVALLIGYMFINLMTDNIYLYITFLIPFYIILLGLIFGDADSPKLDICKKISAKRAYAKRDMKTDKNHIGKVEDFKNGNKGYC